jgi:hypothetical protein
LIVLPFNFVLLIVVMTDHSGSLSAIRIAKVARIITSIVCPKAQISLRLISVIPYTQIKISNCGPSHSTVITKDKELDQTTVLSDFGNVCDFQKEKLSISSQS